MIGSTWRTLRQQELEQQATSSFTILPASCSGFHVKQDGRIERDECHKPRWFRTESEAQEYIRRKHSSRGHMSLWEVYDDWSSHPHLPTKEKQLVDIVEAETAEQACERVLEERATQPSQMKLSAELGATDSGVTGNWISLK